jgi:hypothetical protein
MADCQIAPERRFSEHFLAQRLFDSGLTAGDGLVLQFLQKCHHHTAGAQPILQQRREHVIKLGPPRGTLFL